MEQLNLVTNMRVNRDHVISSKQLFATRPGIDNGQKSNFVKIESELLSEDIVTSIFGEDISSIRSDELAGMAILCTQNEDALKNNYRILLLLHGDKRCYYSVDTIGECEIEKKRTQYPIEFLNLLTPSWMPPYSLQLNKECCIQLLSNFNPKRGVCNGTSLIVEAMGDNLI